MFDRRANCNLAGGADDPSCEQSIVNDRSSYQASQKAERIEAIYARVSTRKQLEYLETQIQGLKAKNPSAIVFRDCASGLNFRRKGLLSLLQ
jgi:predicted site-specific integrase-resolvase